MAIAPLIVAVQTTGANSLRRLGQEFTRAGRTVSTVAGAYRSADGLWRNANGTLVTQRNHLRQNTTVLGHLRNAALAAGQGVSSLGRAGSDLPAMTKVLSGAAAALVGMAPAIGAALNAAILAGLGGAGLGAAIFAAFKDEDLRDKWKALFAGIGADLKNFGRQLVPALSDSADQFRRAWGQAADYVRGLFGDLGSTIGPLTRGLINMMREAAPGIKAAFAAAVPILHELAALLPTLGRGIGSFFESMSASRAGALKGLRFLVLGLAGSLMILGNTIEFLSKWFDFWTTAAEKVYSALAKIPVLGRPFGDFADILKGINEPANSLDKTLTVMSGTTLATAQASREAARAMQELHSKMTTMISAALGADDAMLAWAAATRAVTESVRENGRNLDINTEKGYANVRAILDAVRAAEQKRQADINLAGGERASASAVGAANAAFQAQIGQLEALMRKLGFTQAEIDALLGKYKQIATAPNITKYIDVVIRTRGDANALRASGNVAPGGPNLGYAAGTPSAPRGWAWVGEKGPELVNFRGGEQVIDHKSSMRTAAGHSMGTTGYTVNVYASPLSSPADVGRAAVEAIKAYERTSGPGWRR